MLTSRPAPHRRRQGGLSIVEFMVGIAVGLFVVGGTIKLFVDYLGSNRRMLLETRINQDLRAAADLIARDLRRGAYWRNAHLGVQGQDQSVAPLVNPYRDVSFAAGELTYSYDKDGNTAVDIGTEDFGVRLGSLPCVLGTPPNRGVVQLRTAGGWQTITDPCTMEIASAADLVITELQVGGNPDRIAELWDACACLIEGSCTIASFDAAGPGGVPPAGANFANRPRLAIRQYSLLIRGRSVTPDAIVREISETVRVRNDELIGACPLPP